MHTQQHRVPSRTEDVITCAQKDHQGFPALATLATDFNLMEQPVEVGQRLFASSHSVGEYVGGFLPLL